MNGEEQIYHDVWYVPSPGAERVRLEAGLGRGFHVLSTEEAQGTGFAREQLEAASAQRSGQPTDPEGGLPVW